MSASIELTLGVAQTRDARSSSGAGPDVFAPDLRQKILERDGFACRGCGFKAKKYQEIYAKGHAPADARPDHLVTLCQFCHQCFHLDAVPAMKSGVLIWLPEISQADLHHAARAIYVARIAQGPVADAARRTLDILMQRRDDARKRLGTDDPGILANVLKDYISPHSYGQRGPKLEGIRLFPLDRRIIREAELEFNQFPQILAYWRSKDGPFGEKLPRQWIDLLRHIDGAALAA